MKWIRFTIETTTAAEDFISEKLSEIGVEGIEIEDRIPLTEEDTKGMFIDILPDLGPDDGAAQVSFYLKEDDDEAAILEKVREALREVAGEVEAGSLKLTRSETEDKDWINNWKEFFKPFTVGSLLIKPTWEEVPEGMEDKTLIEIDPGMAFGTGKHETTRLCIDAIQRYIHKGDRLLDVGTGSGILSICGLLFGASTATGTDLDENAIDAARENLALNGFESDRFRVYLGNLINDEKLAAEVGFEAYDIVTANILADVIMELQKVVWRHMKPGAVLITSGIINTMEERVRKAFEQNPAYEIIETVHEGEWVSIIARRKG